MYILYYIYYLYTGCAISFATTSKQAGSKSVKDNENLLYPILSEWKSKILYEDFWSFVLFSAQYYKNEKMIFFSENMQRFMIGKFSQNWKFYLCVIP